MADNDQLTKVVIRPEISVETIVYTSIPVEYPTTSEHGVMYVIDTSTWPMALKHERPWYQDIQYSWKSSYTQPDVNCVFLGDVKASMVIEQWLSSKTFSLKTDLLSVDCFRERCLVTHVLE